MKILCATLQVEVHRVPNGAPAACIVFGRVGTAPTASACSALNVLLVGGAGDAVANDNRGASTALPESVRAEAV